MLKLNSRGFTHIAIFVAGILVIGGLTAFTVQRINDANNKNAAVEENNSETETSQNQATDNSEKKQKKTVKAEGTAVAQSNTAEATKTETTVETSYDITTAFGSLKQVEQDIKSRDQNNLYWFITPRMMFQATEALGLDDPSADISDACEINTVCKLVLASTSIKNNYTTEGYDYPYSSAEGKTLIFKLSDVNNAASKIYGNKTVRIDMLDIKTNWVIDRITVGSWVL